MPAEPNPECDACKENKWWVKNAHERSREADRLRLEVKRLTGRVAYLEWEADHDRWLRRDQESWAQAKVREQAKVLKKLNEKLAKREALKTERSGMTPGFQLYGDNPNTTPTEPPWGYTLKNTEL